MPKQKNDSMGISDIPEFEEPDYSRFLEKPILPEIDIEQMIRDQEWRDAALMESLMVEPQIPEPQELDVGALLRSMEEQDKELMRHFDESFDSTPTLDVATLEPSVEEPDPLPDSSLTIRDVARWMNGQVRESSFFYHEFAVRGIRRGFESRFLTTNRHGNWIIVPEVLAEFLKLTRNEVVWSRSVKFWRKRRDIDPADKRMIE
jgi:hypothetical protein